MRRKGPKGPKGPDIRDVKPTRVILDARLSIDGGTISTSQELSDVWSSTIQAFEKAAHAAGLGFAWEGQISCVGPKTMDARVERAQLEIVMPPGANAEPPASPDAVRGQGEGVGDEAREDS